MLLRLILLFSLIAAVTTVLAAPPRFGFKEPSKPASAVAAPADMPTDKSSPASPNPANPSASEPEPTAAVPETKAAATASAPAGPDKSAVATGEPKKEQRGFFWLFSRKKAEPEPLQYKQQDDLVPTEKYHKSVNEKIKAADLYEYRSGYQSYWKGDASKILCSIRQQIPKYGYVEFRQGVGQPLQFAMFVNHPPAGVGKAHIRVQPPYWRHYVKPKDLGVVELEPGKRAVTMETNWSNRLLLELREGMQPVFRYWDVADATADIEIMLSALNFQESLSLFHNCLGELQTYDVKQAERTILHFHADSSKLRKKAMQQLDELLEVLKSDPNIKQIELELYSSSTGLVQYNFRLSTRRARAVRDYLIKRGINEDQVLIKIHTKTNSELKKLGYDPTDLHVVLQRGEVK